MKLVKLPALNERVCMWNLIKRSAMKYIFRLFIGTFNGVLLLRFMGELVSNKPDCSQTSVETSHLETGN